jgi:hypothetical protein
MNTKATTLLAGIALGAAATIPLAAIGNSNTHADPKDGARAPGGALEEAFSMEPEKIMEMMQEASKPDEHHDLLRKMAGTHQMTAKFWMDPTAEPEISKGTCTSKLIMDGRYLVSDVDMTFGFTGMEMPLQGMSVMGYNRNAGQYETTWIDTLNTAQTWQSGTMKNGQLIVEGETYTPFGKSKLKNVYTVRDGGYDLEFYEPNPMTGEMMRTGIIEYRSAQG